ncbi:hypothetical protein RR46_11788 [Papilio xuthus]|uniref:Uncharacterized protein n=1 Tax=Papilio xuthus TaxID=66420 RepID=A0A194PPX1_PAPXU|nr:hypothetical protein RR46_11788 [Papilio xuthus]
MVNLPKEIDTLDSDTLDKAFSTVPPPEPDNLKDLEYIATRTANYMNPVSWHPKCHQIVMNRVREFYNLEFKMLCDMCGTPHQQDEITAPER